MREFPSQKIGYWRCVCDCGGEAHTSGQRLRTGDTQSCGCLHKEVCAKMLRTHGKTGTRTHKLWMAMRSRCNDPTNTAYGNYGAKGVTVCERWASFESFLADMGECPPGLTLDREKNHIGYEPGNCRWATMQEQQNNRTNNRIETAFGKAQTLAKWARETGMNYGTLHSRLHRDGMTAQQAMTEPLRPVGAGVRHG